jgi:chromate reductase
MNKVKVLGVAGSLRKGSYNRALLRTAQEVAPEEMEIETFDLSDIPSFNADVEAQGVPEPVSAFKQAIQNAHGLLIATPEYNYSIPGVLKNALDWASRPPGQSPLNNKPVAILGASMGMGGTIRAQSHLRQVFCFTESYVMIKPEIYVARAQDKFDAEGHLTDEKTREFLQKFLAAFVEWIKRFG